MNALSALSKLAALSVLVMAAAASSGFIHARSKTAVSAEAASIVLLPGSIAGASPVQSWKNPLDSSVIEEGALYASSKDETSIQLDFYRNSWQAHNGAGCYISQGEHLRSESLHTMTTSNGQVVFDVAVTSSDRHLRLTAATECTESGCKEDIVQFGAPWDRWNFTWQGIADSMKALVAPDRTPVVPVSIVLQREIQDDAEARMAEGEALLLHQFEQVAAEFDPGPAQRLAAALQAGK